MLNKIDLSKNIDKDVYKEKIKEIERKLPYLQRKAKELKIPIILVFEGWSASGKGTIINNLILPLDPRHFKVYTTDEPTEEERLRPFLWRFWTKTPLRGKIAIFDRSWYRRVLSERMDIKLDKKAVGKAFEDIVNFERQLADDGNIILKFFMHIDKKEQEKRFIELQQSKATSWRITKDDWKDNKKYDEYVPLIEEMIDKTNKEYSSWTVVEANNVRFATIKVLEKTIEVLEEKIKRVEEKTLQNNIISADESNTKEVKKSILSSIDLTKKLEREEYKEKIKVYQKKIRQLEYKIYKKRIPVIILYEGWDAAGKGGNIKRLTKKMDPRGYEVIPIAAPSREELDHHYLWRFWKEVPKGGHITIFDRSWYGRVLVERVEGFCSETEWKRSYREINEMEKQFINFGAVIVKFWIHIDQDIQLQRFQERENNPEKQWKITDEDWRNREKYPQYEKAVNEMLLRTSTTTSPWTVIESNDKYYARVKALKTVIDAIETKL
ncbi:polyphosphate:AMP phosphotransferase [Clostridium sp. DL1XJH146]